MTNPERKRVLSCIQPSGEMHIGNYFGAVQNWARLQDDADCVYGVVDLHAMTIPYDPEALKESSRQMFLSLMAAGIDPDRSLMFVQSLMPEHTELCWLMATITSLGDLGRMTQFKEKSGLLKGTLDEAEGAGEFVSAGLLLYPVLQAADILAYRPHYVPVGRDQQQHLELSRGLARRFNTRFGVELFPEPEPLFTKAAKIQSLADPTKKMSKSLGPKHYIGLFEEEDSIRTKVRSAVTDSGDVPEGEVSLGVQNLLGLLTACDREERARAMEEEYLAGTLRYSHLKEEVASAVVELTSGMRARRQEILDQAGDIDDRIFEESSKAREVAGETLRLVREVVGILTRGS